MSLITDLTRRKVFKVGAAYLVIAWLAVQAASIGFPAFDAPPWALRVFILGALLWFPIALVFAWAFDITPDGAKPEIGARSSRGGFTDRDRAHDMARPSRPPCCARIQSGIRCAPTCGSRC